MYYEALDGSGLRCREEKPFSSDARQAVEDKEHIWRRVYRAYDEPRLLLLMTWNAEYKFVEDEAELQRELNWERNFIPAVRNVGLCYIAVYAAVVLYRRRKRAAKAQN